jgi:hypothetical protein
VGTSASYELRAAAQTVPEGDAPVAVAVTLHGLASGTRFDYRLVAEHGSTVTTGANMTLFTEPFHWKRDCADPLSGQRLPHGAQRTPRARVARPRSR